VGILLLAVHLKTGLAGSWSGVLLSHLVFAYAFAFILMEGFWRRDMHALEQLARTLGARGWPLWRRALLPALAGPVALVLVQTFLISWFQYGLTLLVGSGRIQTLPLLVFGFVREADVYLAAAAGLLLVVVPLVLLAWSHDR
jgi:putative spermidine/putrescine transport system permease protein